MKKLGAVLCLGTLLTLLACGGKVLVEASSGFGGNGAGGGPVACPGAPIDSDVQTLVGKPCDTEGTVCASNNGCGGCSVTCKNGVWTSTDAMLCFSVGGTC